MTNFDYIIVGSGISGMSYAHYAAKTGKQVLVIDKKDYAGGCVKSLRHEDFWVELGGHTIYNSYMTFIKTSGTWDRGQVPPPQREGSI